MNCQICGAHLPEGAMFCGGCGSSTSATPTTRKRADPRPSDTTIIQPLAPRTTVISVPVWPAGTGPTADQPADAGLPPVRPGGAHAAAPAEKVEPARYTLQFSTGETVSVRGTGLIGRRPLPQPSERFDHLIQITDLGMSVSKSHLEFGQHDGEFWVNDRFSGNGTVVRRAPAPALRCEPGRRYLVARGARVEIGDQFFVVL
ncbi:FHA domain-containing protein [Cryobacterium sp. N22]|uniref:FHA domain-containing protein n=1 Tax=Cryobacterium sp. N22 TaxID=2048290 RepID=UPI0011B02577|nr:FHA domain-containing protein [Cryobacterium sp. N22]